MANKYQRAQSRKIRVRAKIKGTKEMPRLSVHRSSKHISAQVINDEKGVTLVAFGSIHLADKDAKGKTKMEKSQLVGTKIAEELKKAGIKAIVFDRGSYRYHGRVKALADVVREGGIKF